MNSKEYAPELKNKNILITGGLGFIGSNIAVKLAEIGANVTIMDSLIQPYGGNLFNINGFENKIKVVNGDIRDKKAVEEYIKNKDIIFNLAAQVDQGMNNPILDTEINCMGHLNVLEAAREHSPEAKIIFSGTRMEYGKILFNPVTEEHPSNPTTINAINKLAAEKYYLSYFEKYGMKTTCFRLTNPYGPRAQMKHSKYSVMNWFIRQAMDDGEITIFGEGAQLRDYIYIEDMVDCMIISATEQKTNGHMYNLGSGVPTHLVKMAEEIIDVVGKGKIVKKEWPENYKKFETGDFYADISKIKEHTGWTPKTDLREGIKKTAEYYSKNRHHYW